MIQYTDFDVNEHIVFKEPEKMKSGSGYLIAMSGRESNMVEFQGPPCRLPWGVEVKEGFNGQGPPNCKISLQLDSESGGDEFQRLIEDIESRCQQVILNSPELVGSGKKKITQNVLSVNFTSNIKQSDEKYLPFLSAKAPFELHSEYPERLDLATIKMGIFSPNQTKLSPDVLQKGAVVVPIISLQYCWAISGRFGLTLRCSRVLLVRKASAESNFDFLMTPEVENLASSYEENDDDDNNNNNNNGNDDGNSNPDYNGDAIMFNNNDHETEIEGIPVR